MSSVPMVQRLGAAGRQEASTSSMVVEAVVMAAASVVTGLLLIAGYMVLKAMRDSSLWFDVV